MQQASKAELHINYSLVMKDETHLDGILTMSRIWVR